MNRSPVAVTAQGWGWRHAGRTAWALRNLTLSIEPGERVLLLGASGSGKSTLLHAMSGVLGPDDGDELGSLLVAGRPPASHRGAAGLVLQDPLSNLVLPQVGDEVAFGPENLGVPADQIWPRVHHALRVVGLDGLDLQRDTSHLSGGQQQRLALAGQLASAPGLLLLDEPTANLDPGGARQVRDAVALATEDRRTTLIVVEHRVEIWADLVDRVIVLADAADEAADGLVADNPPAVVFGDHAASLRAAGIWVPGDEVTSDPPPIGSDEEVLRASGVTLGYRSPVRTGVNLGFPDATSSVITGPSASGKTVLALTLAGLLPPLHGTVTVHPELAGRHGRSPIALTSRELLTRIGMVFQQPEHQFLTATVRDELAVGLRALQLPAAQIDRRTDELLSRLRLDHLALAHPFTLSGGQKRRLSVATVLATRPGVVILDEPTFGQDRTTWAEMVNLITEVVADGTAVISVSHDEAYVGAVGSFRIDLGGSEPGGPP